MNPTRWQLEELEYTEGNIISLAHAREFSDAMITTIIQDDRTRSHSIYLHEGASRCPNHTKNKSIKCKHDEQDNGDDIQRDAS